MPGTVKAISRLVKVMHITVTSILITVKAMSGTQNAVGRLVKFIGISVKGKSGTVKVINVPFISITA